MPRSAIHAFELSNPLYKNASVSFFGVANGVKTSTLATLYAATTGTTQLANPQKLNSKGQFKQPIYIDAQAIGTVIGISVPGHDTAIFSPYPSFRVDPATSKLQYSYDGATYVDTGEFILVGRGQWFTTTLYHRTDIVTQGDGAYLCLVEHTSGVFATDLAAGYWALVLSTSSLGISTFIQTLLPATDAPTARATLGATSLTDVETAIQDQTATAFTTGGTSTAYTLTPAPAIPANTTNQRFRVKFHAAAGATPTLAVSGQVAKNLKYEDAAGAKQAITSVQVPINWIGDVEYDGVDWVVLNIPPAAISGTAPIVFSGGAISLNTAPITASLGADVALNNTSNYFDGPSVAQGTVGTWLVIGTVTMNDAIGPDTIYLKLWDGTSAPLASAVFNMVAANNPGCATLMGIAVSPVGNLRISAKDIARTTGLFVFNASGNSKDCTITAIRIG